jgi:hypothetical protein
MASPVRGIWRPLGSDPLPSLAKLSISQLASPEMKYHPARELAARWSYWTYIGNVPCWVPLGSSPGGADLLAC